ncbi:MAG: dihydroxyacetone kinase subunit DhaK [Enterococcus sp.]
MKKIINETQNVVDEMLNGLVFAHGELVYRVDGTDVIAHNSEKAKHVSIISGGGSGHEPTHAGFVGEGMLAAAVCGEVFTSPTPDQVLAAIKAVDNGQGVFLVIKNYSGDVMNFQIAQELAEEEGLKVDYVIVDDDIAVEDSTYTQGRRGVAGTIFVHKILGHAAQSGKSLEEIKAIADELVTKIHTIGVALKAATVPAAGKPGFELEEDEIEYGVGIHGEPGYRKEKLTDSKTLAQELTHKLLDSFAGYDGKYAVMINGMGGTPLMEQFIFTNDVRQILAAKGVHAELVKVGNFMTSIEMQGLSLTLMKLDDPYYLEALKAPVETIAW